jgi:hypothetical protein
MSFNSESYIKECPAGCKYFAARLLFQYRVVIKRTGESNKIRPCSDTVTITCASTFKKALRQFKQIGKEQSTHYVNTDGNEVFVEFVGIIKMIEITSHLVNNETWLSFGELLMPMERKEKFILSDDEILKRIS